MGCMRVYRVHHFRLIQPQARGKQEVVEECRSRSIGAGGGGGGGQGGHAKVFSSKFARVASVPAKS